MEQIQAVACHSFEALKNMPDTSLISVLYISSATSAFTDEQLINFLRSWRDHNAKNQITGFLLYEGGNFMQVLEGPVAAVNTLIDAISGDSRHRRMRILWTKPIPAREFPQWCMGFRKAVDLSPEDKETFSSFLETSKLDEKFREHPGRSHHMLLQFKQVCLRP